LAHLPFASFARLGSLGYGIANQTVHIRSVYGIDVIELHLPHKLFHSIIGK